MSNTNPSCPVCGTMRTDDNSITCTNCGFDGAYYTLFGGEKAYNAWKSLVETYKNEIFGDIYTKKRDQGSELLITSDCVCFFDAGKAKAIISEFNNTNPQIIDNVKQISLSGLFRVWLNNNGTLGSSGDNESGQRDLERLIEIISVSTTSNCTYAVRADGTIASRGSADFKEATLKWTDIISLCCTEKYIIGIKNDSTVEYAVKEGAIFNSYAPSLKHWKEVKKVSATDYYAMALCNDGTVLYAGADDQKSQCTIWKDVVDIAADGQYAVGLTKDGNVLLAGDSSSLIDFGRREAANWKDMVFIAAGRSLIAGLSSKGEFKVVGNVVSNNVVEESLKNALTR